MGFSLFAILELTFPVLQTKISKFLDMLFQCFFFLFFLLKVETQMFLHIFLMLLVIKMKDMDNEEI